MKTWHAEYRAHWNETHKVTVAAKTFAEAVKKVTQVARRRKHLRPRIESLVLTATLDA